MSRRDVTLVDVLLYELAQDELALVARQQQEEQTAMTTQTEEGQTMPLSDARLAEIREHRNEAQYAAKNGDDMAYDDPIVLWQQFASDLTDSLAEVERLGAREVALMDIAQAVAEHIGYYVNDHFRQCAFCHNGAIEYRIIYHLDDCAVEQARALLASVGEASVESEERAREAMPEPCEHISMLIAQDGNDVEIHCLSCGGRAHWCNISTHSLMYEGDEQARREVATALRRQLDMSMSLHGGERA